MIKKVPVVRTIAAIPILKSTVGTRWNPTQGKCFELGFIIRELRACWQYSDKVKEEEENSLLAEKFASLLYSICTTSTCHAVTSGTKASHLCFRCRR